ncbi:MAG: BMP family ABC transporter substrate-binding protein, partial [Clostridia bacterium]|nr:BMP family ABC transporter substrate-binding protein [Clostridia bacterium]
MKRVLSIVICLAMLLSTAIIFASCGERTYEIALVTDVGQLMDKGFNQGTWEGVETYAKANNKTYKYYQPANGSDASDEDRIAAM